MTENPGEFGERLEKIIKAWRELRPNKKFAGMTLEEFIAAVTNSRETRAQIKTLEDQIEVLQTQRSTADGISAPLVKFVVNSIKGDPAEGEDGELYEAIGYIRTSQRKSGLTRKKKTPPTS